MSNEPKSPTLIGLIRLPFAKIVQHKHRGVSELVQRIAFDSEGRAWALVERMTEIEPGPLKGSTLHRLTFARWQAVAPIPFVDRDPIELFDQDPDSPREAWIDR